MPVVRGELQEALRLRHRLGHCAPTGAHLLAPSQSTVLVADMKKISAFLNRNKKGTQAGAAIASGQATPSESASTLPVRVPLLCF
jgi:hypothetical protein